MNPDSNRNMIRTWWGEPPPRILRLKQNLLGKKPELCVERALIVTEVYRKNENKPAILRRASALKEILEKMSIRIYDDELIVGSIAEKQRGAPVFPEMAIYWLEEELDTLDKRAQDPFIVRDEVKERLKRDVFAYWKNKTLYTRLCSQLPDVTLDIRRSGIFNIGLHEEGGLGHVLLDFEKVLKKGFRGIKQEIEGRISCLQLSDSAHLNKLNFLKAALIVCDAAVIFAHRYSQLAIQMAEQETDGTRKNELKNIARVCRRVPEYPAGSFYEALQSVYFTEIIPQIETNGPAVSLGRFDQYLYPYYAENLGKGRITPAQAQELVGCFWIKINEIIKIYKKEDAQIHAGFPMNHNLTVGGISPDGQDVTNDVSYMCLAAHAYVHLIQPNLSVRVSRKTPVQFLEKVAEVIKLGGGMPQLVNDEIIIPALLNQGITIKRARDYGIIGCVEPSIVGLWGRTNGGYFNMAKILELALNEGKDQLTGKQIGIKTKKPDDFKLFDEVLDSYREQMEYIVEHLVVENNFIDMVHAEIMPEPFVSVLVPDCIEKGMDVTWGGAQYNWTGPLGVGVANVGDSLAAIKKLVFDDGIMTMGELRQLLNTNFKDNEDKRLIMHNKAPKYGNDIDYVDMLTKFGVDVFCDEVEKYSNPRGGKFVPSLIPVASNIPLGWITGATPDGRKATIPLADGISPSHDSDKSGPTAVLRSVAKIDHVRVANGAIFNQKFNPSVLTSESGARCFISYLQGFIDLGIQHIQINVVSAETLRNVQKHPEKYPDLVVRVAGYSALFNELSEEVQNDIIERTEQHFTADYH